MRTRAIGRSWFGMGRRPLGKIVLSFLLVFFFFWLESCCANGGMYAGVELSIAMVLVAGMQRGGILSANIIRQGMWRGCLRRRWGRSNISLLAVVETRRRSPTYC